MTVLRRLLALLIAVAGILTIDPRIEAATHHTAVKHAPPPPSTEAPVPDMRIAAVVNDEVISVFDLVSRMKMVELSSNLPDTPETRQRIGGQVLRALVDEKLQLQEAKRQNVVATDDELNAALAQIEKQNNMQPGQLNLFLKSRGIERGSLISQLTASIVWAKLVRRMAAQNTEITDEEVDDAMKRLKEHANDPQSRIAEIFLPVDNPAQDQEVQNLALKLIDQMKQGARFSAVAQQFSQSATAAVGGDMGWLRPDQLPPDLAKAVAPLKPGELSAPVRTNNGYYVLLVIDRRNGNTGSAPETIYDVVQVVFPLPAQPSDAMKRAAVAEAESLRSAKGCPDLLKLGQEKAPKTSSEGKVNAANLAPQLRELITKLGDNQVSQPILQRGGVGVIMVCSKDTSTAKSGEPTRDEVFESLLKQKLDTVSRRYLRDLRRAAYVDVRV
ncbi:MAG TPA: peptidylprolyl isomerase [Stellaceae bacterium]|nr:peptidylprolyl isomerase [Stellaceae bacterium]